MMVRKSGVGQRSRLHGQKADSSGFTAAVASEQPQAILKMNERGGVPIKLYLWNLDFIQSSWAMEYSSSDISTT